MNICENLITGAKLYPEKTALMAGSLSRTYGELELRSGQAAGVLRRLGVERGDRVGLVLPNSLAFPVWYYAALRLGAVAVAVSTRLTAEEIAFILDDCEAKVAVATEDLLEVARRDAPLCVKHVLSVSDDGDVWDAKPLRDEESIGSGVFVDADWNEPAVILYTSGTTGFPKGATLSHQNVRSTMHNHNHHCQMRFDDRLLLAVPLFHCYGQNSLLNAGLNVGATLILQRGFNLNESKALIREHGVTKLFGVPTTFQLMLESCEPEDLATIDYCFSAAATLPLQVTEQWIEKFGMPIYEGYGLIETAPFACYNHRTHYVPGSLGAPIDLIEMKVVDPDTGERCPPGKPGEIAIRGPNVMLGYWNRPEETAEAIRDGWFHSGDIGKQDENGYFFIVDRLKDMISIGGVKVFPAEVERVLRDHPSIADVAVVGFPDNVLGERVVAFVVASESGEPSEEDVQQYCLQRIASFKTPSRVLFVEQLPRNPAGKVLKTKLREFDLPDDPTTSVDLGLQGDAPSAAPSSSERSQLATLMQSTHSASRLGRMTLHLQEAVSDLLNVKDLPSADAQFLDCGMDSLMIVEMRDRLQTQVEGDMTLSATMVFDHPRICDLAAFLVESLEEIQQDADSKPLDQQPPKAVVADAALKPPQQSPPTAAVEEMTEQEALNALMREVNE